MWWGKTRGVNGKFTAANVATMSHGESSAPMLNEDESFMVYLLMIVSISSATLVCGVVRGDGERIEVIVKQIKARQINKEKACRLASRFFLVHVIGHWFLLLVKDEKSDHDSHSLVMN